MKWEPRESRQDDEQRWANHAAIMPPRRGSAIDSPAWSYLQRSFRKLTQYLISSSGAGSNQAEIGLTNHSTFPYPQRPARIFSHRSKLPRPVAALPSSLFSL